MKHYPVLRWTLLAFLLLISKGYAKSTINNVSIYQEEQTVFANVSSKISLPSAVTEAIHSGITLIFSYEFEMKKARWYPTKTIAKLNKNYQLSYSRMTGKYQLDNPITFEREEFNNLNAAINFMESLQAFPLILTTQLPQEALIIRVRFHLSADNLPSYVRVERLFKKTWEADSDWTDWSIDTENILP